MSSLSREVGLLRKLAANVERRAMPSHRLTREWLITEGLARVKEKDDLLIAIRREGHLPFSELIECLLEHLPAMKRGAVFAGMQDELFDELEAYVGRKPSDIAPHDAEALIAHFDAWFANRSATRRVFVPCAISQKAAPAFAIGPVTFHHINFAHTADFYPTRSAEAVTDRHGFDELVQWMRDERADWLAHVGIDGCQQERAEEMAELVVDLAIVALQLAAPSLNTRNMSRLDARRGSPEKRTLSEANGYHSAGWRRKDAGMSIGQGTLADLLSKAAPIFKAVGEVLRSFASGAFRLPVLEQAWCDAAYWFHEALAEPIDAIAMAKLETALEVLVRAASSAGSSKRILEILKVFFALAPQDSVAPGSSLTAREFAGKVVHDRSRVLHGTWSTLNTRGMDRPGMEGFVGSVLRGAVVELEAYAQSDIPQDNITKFLAWIQSTRSPLHWEPE